MSRWRELARRLEYSEGAEDVRDFRDETASRAPIVPIVPIFPRSVPANSRDWSRAIAGLHQGCPPEGIAPERWSMLVADAAWLCRTHGGAAAALGWTASQLFGLDPLPGWGGLSDRLKGSRRVTLTAAVGHWRTDDEEGWLWRGTLRPLPVIWEVLP